MAIKKSELYSSLWASCDELRGSMDARQYKDCARVRAQLTCYKYPDFQPSKSKDMDNF